MRHSITVTGILSLKSSMFSTLYIRCNIWINYSTGINYSEAGIGILYKSCTKIFWGVFYTKGGGGKQPHNESSKNVHRIICIVEVTIFYCHLRFYFTDSYFIILIGIVIIERNDRKCRKNRPILHFWAAPSRSLKHDWRL